MNNVVQQCTQCAYTQSIQSVISNLILSLRYSCGFPGMHDPEDAFNGSCYVTEHKVDSCSTSPQAEDVNLMKNKRLKERDSGKKFGCHGDNFFLEN